MQVLRTTASMEWKLSHLRMPSMEDHFLTRCSALHAWSLPCTLRQEILCEMTEPSSRETAQMAGLTPISAITGRLALSELMKNKSTSHINSAWVTTLTSE